MSSPLDPPTVGDAVRTQQQRLVSATRWAEEHPGLGEEAREELATWIAEGGTPPWEKPLSYGGLVYPPAPTQDGPRA